KRIFRTWRSVTVGHLVFGKSVGRRPCGRAETPVAWIIHTTIHLYDHFCAAFPRETVDGVRVLASALHAGGSAQWHEDVAGVGVPRTAMKRRPVESSRLP